MRNVFVALGIVTSVLAAEILGPLAGVMIFVVYAAIVGLDRYFTTTIKI